MLSIVAVMQEELKIIDYAIPLVNWYEVTMCLPGCGSS